VALPWCRGAVIMARWREQKWRKEFLAKNLNDHSLFIHEYCGVFFLNACMRTCFHHVLLCYSTAPSVCSAQDCAVSNSHWYSWYFTTTWAYAVALMNTMDSELVQCLLLANFRPVLHSIAQSPSSIASSLSPVAPVYSIPSSWSSYCDYA
jgi:hypothetical protein